MSHDHAIVPREKLDFDLDGDIPKYWFGGDAFKTRFFDAMSTIFPEGERYFISCVRDFRDQVNDPQLLAERAAQLNLQVQLLAYDAKAEARPQRQGTLTVEAITLAVPAIPGQLQVANGRYVLATLARAAQGALSGLGGEGAAMPGEAPRQIPLDDAVAALRPVLEDPTVLKLLLNAKYDLEVLAQRQNGALRVAARPGGDGDQGEQAGVGDRLVGHGRPGERVGEGEAVAAAVCADGGQPVGDDAVLPARRGQVGAGHDSSRAGRGGGRSSSSHSYGSPS